MALGLSKLLSSTAAALDRRYGWDKLPRPLGVLTLVASIYVLSVVPEFLVRFCLWLLTHTLYRIRIEGQQHVPTRGPALLVCNHLSHVDGALVGGASLKAGDFLAIVEAAATR